MSDPPATDNAGSVCEVDTASVIVTSGYWRKATLFISASTSACGVTIISYISSIKPPLELVVISGNFWFNINGKHDYNRTHDHQNSILSAVYYIDAEGDDIGAFVAERDDTAEFFLGSYKNITPFTGTSFSIIPLTGFAFLMPSWVKHSVEQNLTDKDRISIAFNLIRHDIEEKPYG